MSEWQPIETAPKDGTVVRLYIPGHPELEGMKARWDRLAHDWLPEPRIFTLGPALDVPDPVYWMPLSEPPKRPENEIATKSYQDATGAKT